MFYFLWDVIKVMYYLFMALLIIMLFIMGVPYALTYLVDSWIVELMSFFWVCITIVITTVYLVNLCHNGIDFSKYKETKRKNKFIDLEDEISELEAKYKEAKELEKMQLRKKELEKSIAILYNKV